MVPLPHGLGFSAPSPESGGSPHTTRGSCVRPAATGAVPGPIITNPPDSVPLVPVTDAQFGWAGELQILFLPILGRDGITSKYLKTPTSGVRMQLVCSILCTPILTDILP
jgi:hypothetical protein